MQSTNERNKEIHEIVEKRMENDETMKEIFKDAKENCENSKNGLKSYFKELYEHAGLEWTEKNDEDIDNIVNGIIDSTITFSLRQSLNIVLDVVYPVKEE